jgi:thiol-disulfide isomerase/thioredoxin
LSKIFKLKNYTFLLVLSLFTTGLFAQNQNDYVNKFVSLPNISVHTLPDSAIFSSKNLPKNTPFLLMFFSPDCDHCHQQTNELLAYKKELKGVKILLLSVAPYEEIKKFYKDFGLASMPNVKVGQDKNFKLGLTYKVTTYPSIFLYDRRAILAKAFVGNIGVPAILDALK